MAKASAKKVQKSALSRLSKAAREAVTEIMEQRDGNLPLTDFLAKYWDLSTLMPSPYDTIEENSQRLKESRDNLKEAHPEWSADEIDTTIRLNQIPMFLKEAAIAPSIGTRRSRRVASGFGDFEPLPVFE